MTRSGIIFSANENLFGKLNEVSYGNTVLREIGVNTIALCYESIKMMYSSSFFKMKCLQVRVSDVVNLD